jgi:hypothetical protein
VPKQQKAFNDLKTYI